MAVREAETVRRLALVVELDEDGGLVADHPRVVLRLDRDGCRCDVLERAAVRVVPRDVPAGEEPDVRVHAQLGADELLEGGRPAVARRVDRPLQPGVTDGDDVDLDPAEFAVVGSLDRREQRVGAHRSILTCRVR